MLESLCLGAVQVGYIDHEVVINPSRKDLQHSQLNLIVSAAERNKVGKFCVIMQGLFLCSRLRLERWSPASHRSALGFIHCSQVWAWFTFGLVARLADDVPANQILRTCCEAQDGVRPSPDWRRARGRPPTTWIHQVCPDTGIPVTCALELADDKSFWWQNGNGRMLWLNASCRDDDDDDDEDSSVVFLFMQHYQ